MILAGPKGYALTLSFCCIVADGSLRSKLELVSGERQRLRFLLFLRLFAKPLEVDDVGVIESDSLFVELFMFKKERKKKKDGKSILCYIYVYIVYI
jgi:hypothetical protein